MIEESGPDIKCDDKVWEIKLMIPSNETDKKHSVQLAVYKEIMRESKDE